MAVEFEIHGVDEINKALKKMPVQLAKKVVTSSLREGAKIIQKEARNLAPLKTGRLRRAIKVKSSKIHNKPRLGRFGVYIKINPGKKRDDRQGAYYGRFVDGGTKRMRPRMFMSRSYDTKTKQAVAFFIKASERGIDVVKRNLDL